MGRTIEELLGSISWRELDLWRDYLYSEPSESEKLRYQFAYHTTMYANMNSKTKFDLTDFMIEFGKKETEKKETVSSTTDEIRQNNKEVKSRLLQQLKGE